MLFPSSGLFQWSGFLLSFLGISIGIVILDIHSTGHPDNWWLFVVIARPALLTNVYVSKGCCDVYLRHFWLLNLHGSVFYFFLPKVVNPSHPTRWNRVARDRNSSRLSAGGFYVSTLTYRFLMCNKNTGFLILQWKYWESLGSRLLECLLFISGFIFYQIKSVGTGPCT